MGYDVTKFLIVLTALLVTSFEDDPKTYLYVLDKFIIVFLDNSNLHISALLSSGLDNSIFDSFFILLISALLTPAPKSEHVFNSSCRLSLSVSQSSTSVEIDIQCSVYQK
jgi:hypothetical protein